MLVYKFKSNSKFFLTKKNFRISHIRFKISGLGFLSRLSCFNKFLKRKYKRILKLRNSILFVKKRVQSYNNYNRSLALLKFFRFRFLVKTCSLPLRLTSTKAPNKFIKFLRYEACIYGFSYQSNWFMYNLWLTLNLKKNIAVPLGLYFQTTQLRKQYSSYFNRKSWRYYVYLIKDSFLNSTVSFLQLTTSSDNFYLAHTSAFGFSDLCIWKLRQRLQLSRIIHTSFYEEDYTISSYHSAFDYYSYFNRIISFFISNSNFKSETFLVRGYDVMR